MSHRILVATRKGLFIYTHGNSGWQLTQKAFLGLQVPMVLHDPRDDALYAAIGHGHFGSKLHRSTDGGESWPEVAPPKYPPKPDDAPTINCPVRGTEIPWNLELIWCLETDNQKPGALWCGTIPGGLFHSPDRGDSWRLIDSLWNLPDRAKWFGGGFDLPGIHSVRVDPRDAQKVYVGVSCGGVWTSADAGQSWKLTADGMRANYVPPEQASDPGIQDAHIMVQCRAHPDTMWVQHHNAIFKTTDAGASWQEIDEVSPSSFGFAAAVHPDDPDTAWFVPAISSESRIPVDGKFVVTRTTDGGKSFDVLTTGLPQQDAYDLVFRHGLDIDPAGKLLAMGSTTGSLWTTENHGDTWQTLNHNLPPIFTVKFCTE